MCSECGSVLRGSLLEGPLRELRARRACARAAVSALAVVASDLVFLIWMLRSFLGMGMLEQQSPLSVAMFLNGMGLLLVVLTPLTLMLAASALPRQNAWRRALFAAAALALVLGLTTRIPFLADRIDIMLSPNILLFVNRLDLLCQGFVVAVLAFSVRRIARATTVPGFDRGWRFVLAECAGVVTLVAGVTTSFPSAIALLISGDSALPQVWWPVSALMMLVGQITVFVVASSRLRAVLRA